jgi:hypothetical protein
MASEKIQVRLLAPVQQPGSLDSALSRAPLEAKGAVDTLEGPYASGSLRSNWVSALSCVVPAEVLHNASAVHLKITCLRSPCPTNWGPS